MVHASCLAILRRVDGLRNSDFLRVSALGFRISHFGCPPPRFVGIGYAAIQVSVMKISDIPQSGHLGTFITFKGRFGQVRRPYVIPANPRSPAQMSVRGQFGRASARWRTLTEKQRAAWIVFAADHRSRPNLNQSGRLTGCQLYVRINDNLAFLGLPPMDDPPQRPEFDANPVGDLVITNSGSVLALKLAVPAPPTPYMLVWATRPTSAGVSFPGRFVFIGLLPDPVAGFSDITGLYVARYGLPPEGSRVFIQTLQQINGWRELPTRVTAVVPKG